MKVKYPAAAGLNYWHLFFKWHSCVWAPLIGGKLEKRSHRLMLVHIPNKWNKLWHLKQSKETSIWLARKYV